MMFNVPGWSVSSASLQTQAEKKATAEIKGAESSKANGNDPDSTTRPSKKRKRGGKGRSSATQVTADNLVTLWEKHIERKAAPHVHAPSKDNPPADPTTADNKISAKKQKREEIRGESGKTGVDTSSAVTATPQSGKDKFERRKLSKQKRHEAQAAGLLPPTRMGADSAPSTQSQTLPGPDPPAPAPAPAPAQSVKLTPLQVSMRQKLISARFRHLNQTLYTSPSTQSLSLFAENPQMFHEYHEGFRKQVEVWPENPVDGYIQTIRERGAKRFESQKGRYRKEKNPGRNPPKSADGSGATATSERDPSPLTPLPRTDGLCTIADLGCGDAKLARTLTPDAKKLRLHLLSYDLQAPTSLVTRADIAHLPLADASVDVAIFCLALMGTNWLDFVEEAYRVLRWRGELWVAEIKSRFGRVRGRAARGPKQVEHSVGKKMKKQVVGGKGKLNGGAHKGGAADDVRGDGEDVDADLLREIDGADPAREPSQETDVSAFIEVLRKRGFALKDGTGAVDLRNKMFVKMEFVKALSPIRGKGVPAQSSGATGAGAGAEDGGHGKWRPRTKFIDRVEDEADAEGEGDEAGVLKPCVYKLR